MRSTVQFGIAVTFYRCKKSVVHVVNCAHVSFKVFSAMMIDFLGFNTMYRFSVLWMDVMSSASGWLNWFRCMLQLWRGGNSLKLPHIFDIFFDPITSASILTTAVTLKMEAVCSFVHSFKMSEHLVIIHYINPKTAIIYSHMTGQW